VFCVAKPGSLFWQNTNPIKDTTINPCLVGINEDMCIQILNRNKIISLSLSLSFSFVFFSQGEDGVMMSMQKKGAYKR